MSRRSAGGAESPRTLLRSLAQAAASLAFGALAGVIAGVASEQAPVGTHPQVISPGAARGLEIALLIVVSASIAAGLVLWLARRTYPRDAATAACLPGAGRCDGLMTPAGSGVRVPGVRIHLEEIDGDEVVVRITVTPERPSDGPKLAKRRPGGDLEPRDARIRPAR